MWMFHVTMSFLLARSSLSKADFEHEMARASLLHAASRRRSRLRFSSASGCCCRVRIKRLPIHLLIHLYLDPDKSGSEVSNLKDARYVEGMRVSVSARSSPRMENRGLPLDGRLTHARSYGRDCAHPCLREVLDVLDAGETVFHSQYTSRNRELTVSFLVTMGMESTYNASCRWYIWVIPWERTPVGMSGVLM